MKVIVSRGFTLPKARVDKIDNPLTIDNNNTKPGLRLAKGVSFSTIVVAPNNQELSTEIARARSYSEGYARTRLVSPNGVVRNPDHEPMVVQFSIDSETWPLLQGKCFKSFGKESSGVVINDEVSSFDDLVALGEAEVVIDASKLTQEDFRNLHVEVGMPNENGEFEYRDFIVPSVTGEGKHPSLGESGTNLI